MHMLSSFFYMDKIYTAFTVKYLMCKFYSSGCFSCERTHLLGLHKLHRRTLWIIKGTAGATLRSGIYPPKTGNFVYSANWIMCLNRLTVVCLIFFSCPMSVEFLSKGSLFSYIFFCMQMILILTKSVNRCFERNPKFDMTSLLGGTEAVFSSLIHSLSWYNLMLYSMLK